MNCTIVLVITGDTGLVTKGLNTVLEAVPGKRSSDSLQKTAVLGTSHIIRKVLQCGTGSLKTVGIGFGLNGRSAGGGGGWEACDKRQRSNSNSNSV